VNVRSARFLDRDRAALESLVTVLERSGSAVSPLAAKTQLSAIQANRERAIAGNNIFNKEHSLPRGGNSSSSTDWNLLNAELGGATASKQSQFGQSSSTLPSLGRGGAGGGGAGSAGHEMALEDPSHHSRDEAVQQMLVRASQVPTEKYPQPILESHELGWNSDKSRRPLPQFSYGLHTCEITKFQELSGSAPKRSTKKE
jgi:hypothetical protein